MGRSEEIPALPWLLLQTCVIRAWDLSKPLLFCPAMNTAMWEHPITAHHLEQLKAFGYTEIPCVVKKLVCGDEGQSFSWLLPLSLPCPGGMCCLLLCGHRDVELPCTNKVRLCPVLTFIINF